MVELDRLVAALGGELHAAQASHSGRAVDVVDVRLDSRFVGAGDLFAALPGRAADGATFVGSATARGAVAVLSPAPLADAHIPVWVHERARRVAGEAAALVHGRPSRDMTVVAVTGTNGKTTTAHLAGQLLALVGRRVAVLGTIGHRLAGGVSLPSNHTTPDAPELQRLLRRHRDAGGDAVALELSSHALDQERHAGLDVSVAVFTNLTRDHLDYHGDMDAYRAAKRRLFEGLDLGAAAVVHAADPAGEDMARAARARGARVVTYGVGSRVDLGASHVVPVARGTQLILEGMGISEFEVTLPLVGRHNVENALAALAAVLMTGASPSHALGGLAALSPAPGRLEPVDTGLRGFGVFVDYAHTPDALTRVLAALREQIAAAPAARLLCVFGAGGDRDPGKRAPMGAAVGRGADLAILTSDNPRGEDPAAIARDVLAGLRTGGCEHVVELDRRAAIALAFERARPGDVVLIAGKGHETGQTVAGTVQPFDDREVARELLGVRGKEG
ncbi:MAG TPA: UDP-N-acetylmuramoyl-L-alanyl-D-glutamate--2,6-diaminopimelate ligase [Planctomycetota bacterium]|nr:UDP-N-acetylmuramoyl-L-alanyl-D-glutamate--2,6-diaminopimelate ligase [Planctomycetota bacterium]